MGVSQRMDVNDLLSISDTETNFMYNDSLHPPRPTYVNFMDAYQLCMISEPSNFMIILFTFVSILFHLPLSISILRHGLQKCRKNPSAFLSAISPSDYIVYHLVTMEMIGVLGNILGCFGVFGKGPILDAGNLLQSFNWFGEMLFHLLTCVEQYLAVNHPITYRNLRTQRGTRIRTIGLSCVWLLCFAGIAGIQVDLSFIMNFCLLIISVAVVSFCSLSVLSVLIRPGPGNQRTGRERGDQSKRRAFYTILSVLGVLVLRFLWGVAWAVVFGKQLMNCVMLAIDVWFNLPSSVVLQFLFLHRAGKLQCHKTDVKAELNHHVTSSD